MPRVQGNIMYQTLDNPERRMIYNFITKKNNVRASVIANELNIHRSDVRRHIQILEKAGLVHSESVENKNKIPIKRVVTATGPDLRHYHKPNQYHQKICIVTESPAYPNIIKMIKENPGLSMSNYLEKGHVSNYELTLNDLSTINPLLDSHVLKKKERLFYPGACKENFCVKKCLLGQ